MLRALLFALLACASAASAGGTPSQAQPKTVRSNPALEASLEGQRRFDARDFAGAARKLQQAIDSPGFATLTAEQQHMTLLRRGVAALQLRDGKRALEMLRRSSTMEEAGPFDWIERLEAALFLRDVPESARSLTGLAWHWPQALPQVGREKVHRVAARAEDLPDPNLRFELLEALFRARWKPDGIEPSFLWKDLTLLLLERDQPDRANLVASRVIDPRELIAMRADRRFDPVVQSAPDHFDVSKAQHLDLQERRLAVANSPRSLWVLNQLVWALLGASRYKEVLDLTGEAVRRASAAGPSEYDDADVQLVWIRDSRAIALRGLARWDESIEELREASQMPEQRTENVSQRINLASVYCAFNRPKDALAAIEGVIPNVSPYGRMLVERDRFIAALELNDHRMEKEALEYLRQHRTDAAGALQDALLEANDPEEGSRLLLSRLADPKLRSEALLGVQSYARPPLPPRALETWNRWEALLERAEVQAGLAKVGRRERYDLPPPY